MGSHVSRTVKPESGRPPQVDISNKDKATLRNLYMRINRTGSDGSKICAARIAAQTGAVSPELAAAILKPRAGNALPKCVVDAMHTPPAIHARQRNAKNADLHGLYCPGALRMDVNPDGTIRRLHPGERQSWDDATINFGVVIPWPWGGDPCSDRYGVRLGRFQLLTCVDDATDYCPGFDYVIRPSQGYRAEDVIAAQFRLWQSAYKPSRVMLEGHCWQARRARAFLAAADVDIEDATGRPNSKLVEGFFNRLWAPLSLMPGNVGRYRGEQLETSQIYIACRNGRKDPRKHFPELNQALDDIAAAIHYLNTKPVHSRRYGSWIPAEMHAAALADNPRTRLDAGLRYHAAPVAEERIIRRGMVQVTCPSPYGESFTYHFAEERLWTFEGRPVMIYFDPWAGDLTADIVLKSAWRGVSAGTRIAEAVCLEDAPQVKRTADAYRVEISTDGRDRAIAMRKAQRNAIRREHREIAEDGRVTVFTSETRCEGEAQTIEPIPTSGTGVPPVETTPRPRQEDWREGINERLAEADRYEAEARRRGELIPA